VILVCPLLCQPDGWRMADRYFSCRYELSGRNLGTASIIESILNEVDCACFGWVQVSPTGSIVAERVVPRQVAKLKGFSPQIGKTDCMVCIDVYYSFIYEFVIRTICYIKLSVRVNYNTWMPLRRFMDSVIAKSCCVVCELQVFLCM
jgi:hypothetical protein